MPRDKVSGTNTLSKESEARDAHPAGSDPRLEIVAN